MRKTKSGPEKKIDGPSIFSDVTPILGVGYLNLWGGIPRLVDFCQMEMENPQFPQGLRASSLQFTSPLEFNAIFATVSLYHSNSMEEVKFATL